MNLRPTTTLTLTAPAAKKLAGKSTATAVASSAKLPASEAERIKQRQRGFKQLAALNTTVSFAADSLDSSEDANKMLEALKAAFDEQGNVSTAYTLATPDGPVIYENGYLNIACQPILAIAAEGDGLHGGAWLDWLKMGIPAFLRNREKTKRVLGPLRPAHPISLDRNARLAVFGDGGYRGLAQRAVLNMIKRAHKERPYDAVIHLGDTYFGGTKAEMLRHLVEPLIVLQREIKVKVFSLCGNHDLYDGPDGYRSAMNIFGQPGRYFLLETPDWNVACLDTAVYASDRLMHDGKLDRGQLAWLRELAAQKPTLVMSHHSPLSAWEGGSPKLVQQLKSVPNVEAWYWGHEHRSVAYGEVAGAKQGFCVGNGVFLEPKSPPKLNQPVIRWQPPEHLKCTCFGETERDDWPHGFLEVDLSQGGLKHIYHLEHNGGSVEFPVPVEAQDDA